MARIWITDGSVPVFSDTVRLDASHPGMLRMPVRYEGFVDPDVAVGEAAIAGGRRDVLFVEAEWCVAVPDGASALNAATPIVLQGLIEGKWMNRLLGTRAWQPASLGNNLLAAGHGIHTTMGALEREGAGEIRVEYRRADLRTQVYTSTLADLRGQNVLGLVRDVLAACGSAPPDWIDLGANGTRAAVVNEPRRIRASARPLPDPRNLLPHRAKERLVRAALADGIGVLPGEPVALTTTDSSGAVVGRGTLAWERAD